VELGGLVGIVTGGGRGIGRHLTTGLAAQGARLAINWTADGVAAELVRREVEQGGAEAITVQADVSVPDQAHALAEETVKRFGRLDFVVNNAGIARDALLENMTAEEWSAVVATNLNGPYHVIAAAIPHLKASRGSVVNIGSRAATAGFFGTANYSASKAGLIALGKSAAKELGRFGIRVNTIAPPFVPEGIVHDHPKRDALERRAREESLLGVHTSPKDLVDFVVYLLRPGRQVTGQLFTIDSRFH
jgi:NAD(P)-dependent dehydrogenase (short-subunit alcohol dehydrogenase family)